VNLNLPTPEDRETLLRELKLIFESDKSEERLRYNTRKAEVAETLGVTQMDVHRALIALIEDNKRNKKPG
jgi:hypothetical protein